MHLIKNDGPIANMASQLGRLLIYGDYGLFFCSGRVPWYNPVIKT